MKLNKKNLQLYIDHKLVSLWKDQASSRFGNPKDEELLEGKIEELQEIREVFLGSQLAEAPAHLDDLPSEDDELEEDDE
jgi:hypothetical protein